MNRKCSNMSNKERERRQTKEASNRNFSVKNARFVIIRTWRHFFGDIYLMNVVYYVHFVDFVFLSLFSTWMRMCRKRVHSAVR